MTRHLLLAGRQGRDILFDRDRAETVHKRDGSRRSRTMTRTLNRPPPAPAIPPVSRENGPITPAIAPVSRENGVWRPVHSLAGYRVTPTSAHGSPPHPARYRPCALRRRDGHRAAGSRSAARGGCRTDQRPRPGPRRRRAPRLHRRRRRRDRDQHVRGEPAASRTALRGRGPPGHQPDRRAPRGRGPQRLRPPGAGGGFHRSSGKARSSRSAGSSAPPAERMFSEQIEPLLAGGVDFSNSRRSPRSTSSSWRSESRGVRRPGCRSPPACASRKARNGCSTPSGRP